jgi:glycosyltransferase involved in cell wall biosynthesis
VPLGFACKWDRRPQDTWSHTPWALLQALRHRTHVQDLGPRLSDVERLALMASHARRGAHGWSTSWEWSRATDLLCEQRLRRRLRLSPCDVVLQIQDLSRLPVPYGVYQDLSFDLLAQERHQRDVPQFQDAGHRRLARRSRRQRGIYEDAAAVFAMSNWFARSLTELSGVPAERVRTIHPGCNAPLAHVREDAGQTQGPLRLLFVGRDFRRKGGDLVVAALPHVRRLADPQARLTVAGPVRPPAGSAVPDGVDFIGPQDTSQMAALYATHDVFVLPSRFEAFGISLVEALAHGLPCVARNAFAMPEIVLPGINGDLIDGEDPEALAAVIVRVVEDEGLRRRTRASASATRDYFSWDRAAAEILATLLPQDSAQEDRRHALPQLDD